MRKVEVEEDALIAMLKLAKQNGIEYKTCDRPVGAPGWYDGECILPERHNGDCYA